MRVGLWIAASMLCAMSAQAQGTGGNEAPAGGLIESVKSACQSELASHCKDVTPGEARALACLYAYEDKLSPRCEYALYDASRQLERVVSALAYVGNECEAELEKYCAKAVPGEGRLRQCLDKNAKQLSKRCSEALRNVGVE